MMGFRLSKNFERPYFSKSIKEFWRRWHITLTAWFKDYVYIPLGGNRRSKSRNYFNIMLVFILSGLWHGAAINFLIWGTLHGVYQVLGDLLKPFKEKLIKTLNIRTHIFGFRLLQVLITFVLVDFAWIFFRAGTFTLALTLIKNMFVFNPWIFTNGSIFKLGLDQKDLLLALFGVGIVLAENLMQKKRNLRLEFSHQNIVLRWSVYLSSVIILLIFGVYGSTHSMQQFIYFQF